MNISENLKVIQDAINDALVRSGRKPGEVTLIAVTKTVELEPILEAIASGVTHIGENRVQEAKLKFDSIPSTVEKHFIGHLQTNKVKTAVELFDVIQSVDRLEVAQEIQTRAESLNKIQRVMIQVNTSGEASKFGCRPEETGDLTRAVASLPHLKIEGLMTIGPLNGDPVGSFQSLKKWFDELKSAALPGVEMQHLSMGMSGDYPIAIQEGSTMIRIGTAIFGARNYT